ncbi:MAG: putative transposase [Gammaproteobacteria bacterium]|jgi:putative transposase
MVVMDQFTRQFIGFAVHAGPIDGPSVCRLFNSILGGSTGPRYLSSDNLPLFKFHRCNANLRILDVAEIKTVPYVPLSHPFVERLIGTVRREFLDYVPFWGARDLKRKLHSFKAYYNQDRVHRGLEDAIPDVRLLGGNSNVARLDDYQWKSRCRGLYQLPIAA